MYNIDMSSHREVAIAATELAGQRLLDLSLSHINYEMKGERDIQAQADLDSEQIIIDAITSEYPTHSIVSEEAGHHDKESEYSWWIDPLDGTVNYAKGIDEYGISIALDRDQKTILGVIGRPSHRQLFVAEKGSGAYLNGEQLTVSSETALINCLAGTDTTSNSRKQNFEILANLANKVRQVRIFGSSALAMARLAEGQIDVYYKAHYNHWDYAAGVLIAQEAGATVTDFEGQEITPNSKNIIVANNTAIHQQVADLIAKTA
jgi:myo-inositol-1(or 4)-monophosphatase